MRYVVLGVLGLWFLSCSQNAPTREKLKVYFDLDSVLNEQILLMDSLDYTLKKTVTMDQDTEEEELIPDSSGWVNEFRILRDFDLNKPYNVGAYTTSDQNGKMMYTLSDTTLDAPVRSFAVEENGARVTILGNYFEDKTLYQHSREFSLTVDDGLLASYHVSGYQKIVLKDTIKFRISAVVIE